jgi:hypothetical protein
MTLFVYLAVGLLVLAGLALMIHRIAVEAGKCPERGAVAMAARVTITTGFVAIGGGVVLLVAVLPLMVPNLAMMVFALGINCLILGLGFTQAITTLRAAVRGGRGRPVPMEPVLA